jgi:multicomponent Na+:H+ antiporter subunit C
MTYVLGCLFLIVGIYFLLRDTWPSYVYGMVALGNGVNLIIFSIGVVKEDAYPFINKFSEFVDPLTQALVLTAIVISFATLCFVVAVIKKLNQLGGDT